MRKMFEVFRFELRCQLRRISTLVYVLMMLVLCSAFMRMMSVGSHNDGSYFNSPFAVMVTVMFGSMLALLIVAGFAADAATRDIETRMDALFYTAPAGKPAYVFGRFLGAFCASALLLLALPAGCFLASWMPWVDPAGVGPTHISAYLRPFLLLVLPNALVATALLFSLAALSRRAIASYAGGAFLFFSAIVCNKLLAPRVGWSTAKMLDPLGFTTVQELWKSLRALQMNAFVLTADAALLTNRLLWLGVAAIVLMLTYARFRFAHVATGGRATAVAERHVETRRIAVPATRRVFDRATRMRQLLAVAMRSFRDLHASRVWWIVPLLALMFVNAAPELASLEMGIPGPLTTARLVEFFSGDMSLLLTLLIALSAGELVWRERSARIDALAGVTPVPDWIPVLGKFLGLAMMLAATQLIFLVAGLAVQTMVGAERYDLPLYVQILFGLQLPEYLLTAALALIVHVLVNQKYVANALIVLVPVATDLVRALGVEEPLLLYGTLPKWMYSEISGFGMGLQSRFWFTLYFGGWALLFALVTYLFWIRGEEHDLRARMALARRRVGRGAAIVGATALAVIAGAGGFIYRNTHVLDEYRTTASIEQQRAEFERRYGRYASLPQPVTAAAKLQVDFYPQRGTATIRGSYRLENRSSARIETIHVATGVDETAVSFDRPSRVTVDDPARDYRIYTLARALEPGQSLQMNFVAGIASHPFANYGTPPVVRNGSVLMHRPGKNDHWLPLIGYQASRELNNRELRKKYGLRERPPYPRLGDKARGSEQKGYEQLTLETIVGTDAGQIGVAPGELRRTWTANGRSYAHYVTDAPISNAWTITSAKYTVRRAKWRNVNIEVFHHPSHTANVDSIVRGVQASLDYNTREYGPYRYRQLRLVEYPSYPYWLQMTAHSGLITYAEGFGLVRSAEDPRKIDFPFAVATHETSHQWWGHQLTPAMVEGAALLTESLAWYSGMLAVEETLGRDHLQRILDMMRAQYLGPKQPREAPLLRAVEHADGYRTGPFAMYALREAAGPGPVNRALRNLLAKFPPGRTPYPTTLDFYAELRASTPPSMHGLLKDLFEDITSWDLRAKSIDVKAIGSGAHRVTLHLEATKLKGDGTGKEHPVPMNDLVEIAVYDANGKPLHRASHRIRSGAQTIEVTVARPPARAEIDPDHELLDRDIEDNVVSVEGKITTPGA